MTAQPDREPKISPEDWAILAGHVANMPVDFSQPTVFVSTFSAALREARHVTGRNVDTGEHLGEPVPALWAGTLVYFALLDQIGGSLRPADTPIDKPNPKGGDEPGIKRALRLFGPADLTETDQRALYGLRNAFAHDFALTHDHERNRYAFAVSDTPGEQLISHAAVDWDGEFDTLTNEHRTVVNLVAFGDLCEWIVMHIRALSNSRKLRTLDDGHDAVEKLHLRYSMRITPNLDDDAEQSVGSDERDPGRGR